MLEVLTERRVVFGDARQRVSDGSRHRDPSAFGGGASSAVASAEPHGAGELGEQELALVHGLCLAPCVAGCVGVVDVSVDLGETAAIGGFGSLIEHRTSIASAWRCRTAARADKVEDVELASGISEQPREVVHPARIADAHGVTREDERPDIALSPKGRLLSREGRRWVLSRWAGQRCQRVRCGLVLARCPTVVPEREVGVPERELRRGGLVRSADLRPQAHRPAEPLAGSTDVAIGKLDPCDRDRRGGAQRGARVAIGDLSQLRSFLERAVPVLEAYAAGQQEDAVAMFLAAVSGMDWPDCHALLEARVPGMVMQAIKDATTFFEVELPGLTQWSFGEPDAAKIRRPTLSILGGETAPLWIEVAEFLRGALPYVEERTIPGVGHLLHLQRPGPVAEAIAEFLGRNPMP